MLTRRWLPVLAAPAMLLAACGAGSDDLSSDDARAMLLDLPAHMADVEQVQFEAGMTVDGLDEAPPELLNNDGFIIDPDDFRVVASGGLDMVGDQASARLDMEGYTVDPTDPGYAESSAIFGDIDPDNIGHMIELRLVDGTAYARGLLVSVFTGADADRWVDLGSEESGGYAITDIDLTPDTFASFLDAFDEDTEVEVVGTEEVRDTETTHLRIEADPSALASDVGLGMDLFQLVIDGPIPVDLWLDEDGNLRQVSFHAALSEAAGLLANDGDEPFPLEVDLTVELFAYGEELNLAPPPAGEIASPDELDGGIFSGLGQPPSETPAAE